MPKNLKIFLSLLIAVPAFFIFCGEMEVKYFWIQLLAGAILIGILVWNGVADFKLGRK